VHSKPTCQATLPATDLDRAIAFYRDKLGLEPVEKNPGGVAYEGASGSRFFLYPSQGTASGTHTQLALEVDDIEATVAELKGNGVVFEEYDTPELKTENSIARTGDFQGGWFKDSEGNMIGVMQRVG
jgi:catechol 2,3-dioxygenase-like lactoylglutathione lyase family enzyme